MQAFGFSSDWRNNAYSYANTSLIVNFAALRAGMTLATMESTTTTPSHKQTPQGVKIKAKC